MELPNEIPEIEAYFGHRPDIFHLRSLGLVDRRLTHGHMHTMRSNMFEDDSPQRYLREKWRITPATRPRKPKVPYIPSHEREGFDESKVIKIPAGF